MSSLSRAYRYRVICEDGQMEVFIRRLLKDQGINVSRQVYFDIAPRKNCGEQYVREHLKDHMAILHEQNYNRLTIIAFTDADTHSVEDREKMLVDGLTVRGNNYDKTKDCLMFLIPKRNIETWIRYFEGNDTDENAKYEHLSDVRKCRPMAIEMSRQLKIGNLKQSAMSSLVYAQNEYDRICRMQH